MTQILFSCALIVAAGSVFAATIVAATLFIAHAYNEMPPIVFWLAIGTTLLSGVFGAYIYKKSIENADTSTRTEK